MNSQSFNAGDLDFNYLYPGIRKDIEKEAAAAAASFDMIRKKYPDDQQQKNEILKEINNIRKQRNEQIKEQEVFWMNLTRPKKKQIRENN